MKAKHIVIDARIRRASTGRPVDKLLDHLQTLNTSYGYSILLAPDDPWKPSDRKFKTVACKYRQFSLNPWQQVAFAYQLYRLNPDLVYFTQTGQQPLFYFGTQITLTHDLTMFKYARAGRLPKWLHWLRMKGYHLLVWQSHKKARKIIVPSMYVRDAVAKFHLFTNRKIVVAYEASDPPTAVVASPPEIQHSNYIMYVGTTFPHKNLKQLVRSFELLKINHPELKLVLVGKIDYHAKRLRRWVGRREYGADIVFTGFVPENELKWLYQHASAYVFPSLSEGFGLPPLEAMTHGCPVVSSNATCLPEIYGDAAVYFNPLDTADLTDKINQVISSPKLRSKLIEKGYAQVKKYSWKKMAEQTLAVYDEILKQKA